MTALLVVGLVALTICGYLLGAVRGYRYGYKDGRFVRQVEEQKPAEASAAAEAATDSNEIQVCKRHVIAFCGNDPCDICNMIENGGGWR